MAQFMIPVIRELPPVDDNDSGGELLIHAVCSFTANDEVIVWYAEADGELMKLTPAEYDEVERKALAEKDGWL